MHNPELKKGDMIVLLHMDGEFEIPMGTIGVVTKNKETVQGSDVYSVKWEWNDGNRQRISHLGLCSDVDAWMKLEDWEKRQKTRKKINETDSSRELMKNAKVFQHFNMKFLHQYLKMVRGSGITNMFASSPYLYMGKDKIEHEFKYRDIPNEDDFEQVLENANQAQAEMINGVLKVLDDENKPHTLENINRYIQKYSHKVVEIYMIAT